MSQKKAADERAERFMLICLIGLFLGIIVALILVWIFARGAYETRVEKEPEWVCPFAGLTSFP
jgi:hypothetical protein